MKNLIKDWEFNVLGVDNYRSHGKLKFYYDFIRKNHDKIKGDICEVGVFKGFSLLATALLLKELGSNKIVWGYDTFEGFPRYHVNDDLDNFHNLFVQKKITKEHYEDFKKNLEYKTLIKDNEVTVKNISTSEDFSNNSLKTLTKKINFLGLDNIRLIKGDFKDTMVSSQNNLKFFASLIDCDLYESYKISLPFVYKNLVKGGYIYLDEYYSLKFPGAKIATDEFFKNKKSKPFKHETYIEDFERWGIVK